ncbi:MAG: prenyltransferase/squalene oxidase repeat-containing protein, partial [Brooklawnia sp.]|uniref:hypothetical protein n=1 Tax=Brooklawnia sp. TaxID=2699740 RepID=UPI003C72708C
MKLRTRAAAIALTTGLVLGGAPLLAGPALSHAAPTEAVQHAADWLAGQFVDDQHLVGFDGATPDPTYTIDGALALVAAGGQPETVDAATEWVASQAAVFVSNPGSAARTAILADAVGADLTDFGGVNLVEQMQAPLDEATFANPYGLGMLVIAMDRTDTEVPAAVLDALLATQDDQGAFGFPEFGVDIDSTAIAALALGALEDNEQAQQANERAVEWLLANQCTETSQMCPETGAYWGSFSPANTSGLAIQALRQAGEDVTEQEDWLLGQQQTDGGFPAAIGAGYSDAYATAQAILGLSGTDLINVGTSAGSIDDAEPAAADDADGVN